jgi:hypothetical protein
VTCPQRPPRRGTQGAPHGEVQSARVATPRRNRAEAVAGTLFRRDHLVVRVTRRRGSTSLDVVSREVMPWWCTGLRLRSGRVRGSGCVLLADDVEYTSTPAVRPCCDPLSRPRCRWLAPRSPRGEGGRWCGPRSVRVDDAGRSHVTGLRGGGLVPAGVVAIQRPRRLSARRGEGVSPDARSAPRRREPPDAIPVPARRRGGGAPKCTS